MTIDSCWQTADNCWNTIHHFWQFWEAANHWSVWQASDIGAVLIAVKLTQNIHVSDIFYGQKGAFSSISHVDSFINQHTKHNTRHLVPCTILNLSKHQLLYRAAFEINSWNWYVGHFSIATMVTLLWFSDKKSAGTCGDGSESVWRWLRMGVKTKILSLCTPLIWLT